MGIGDYERRLWESRAGTGLNKFTKSEESASSVKLTNSPDSITNPGTAFTADAMNNIEDGIEEALQISNAAVKKTGDTMTGLLRANAGIVVGTLTGSYEAGSLGYSDGNFGFLHRPPQIGSVAAHVLQNFGGADIVRFQENRDVVFYGNTEATSKDVAAVVIADGGLGVEGNICLGGSLKPTGGVSVEYRDTVPSETRIIKTYKEVAIGAWDMNAVTLLNVNTNLSASEALTISNLKCTIYDNSGNASNLESADCTVDPPYIQGGIEEVTGGNLIPLRVSTGSLYRIDGSWAGNGPNGNRGVVSFMYTPDTP